MNEAEAEVLVTAGELQGLVTRKEALKKLSIETVRWRLFTAWWSKPMATPRIQASWR